MNSLNDNESRARFRQDILAWYDGFKRDLPWRKSNLPYEIWISEVMLQQTQVKTVLEYYHKFLAAFPDMKTLAESDLDRVLKVWEGMGYYARARNLHRAARHIMKHLGGKMPNTFETLQAIPGIGPYTAAAIASIAFNEPVAVVDGNVARVLSRLFLIKQNPKQPEAQKQLNQHAQALIDEHRPGEFNQAMMELGSMLCTPRKPRCLLCPVSRFCRALHELEDPAVLPAKKPKKELPHYPIAVGVIWDDGHIFIDRRQEDGLLGGLWEFPGGKIEEGELPEETVRREIKEELNLDVEVGDYFMEVRHAYTHFKITLLVYHCMYKGGEPVLNAATDWRWVKPEELKYFAFASANQKIIRRLEQEFAAKHG